MVEDIALHCMYCIAEEKGGLFMSYGHEPTQERHVIRSKEHYPNHMLPL